MEIAGKEMKIVTLDHLGIVAATCKDLGLEEKINTRLHSNDPRRIVSPGKAILAMILNGLGFSNRRLYLTPQFFQNKPVEKLLGPELEAKHIDDHTLGKALDEIAAYGVTNFFGELAFSIAQEQGLLSNTAHNDTTSFSFEGAYDGEDEAEIVKIMHGYSKDGRHDLKQIVMNLVTTGRAGIPLWMAPKNGNATDVKSLQETIVAVKKFQKGFKIEHDFRWTMDAAWYCEANIQNSGKTKWLSRVPEKIKSAKTLTELSDKSIVWQSLGNGYKIFESETDYGNVAQRWVLVHSEQANTRESKTFLKNLDKKMDELKKSLWHLGNELFTCEKDATKSLAAVKKKHPYFIVSHAAEAIRKHKGRGRPQVEALPEIVGYKIKADFVDNAEEIALKLSTKGRFILATNDMDTTHFPAKNILEEYKAQQQVERGFRFLKDPWFMADTFYLKTPERISALMSVMALCLMVYNIAQYRFRESLAKSDETIPNQINKPAKNPTLRWIFQMMEGINIVKFYDKNMRLIKEIIANFDELRQKIIKHFGKTAMLIYGIA